MNNGINPAYGIPAAPMVQVDVRDPVHEASTVQHNPPPIKLEYLQKKQAVRRERDAHLEAKRAAGAPEPARKTLAFERG